MSTGLGNNRGSPSTRKNDSPAGPHPHTEAVTQSPAESSLSDADFFGSLAALAQQLDGSEVFPEQQDPEATDSAEAAAFNAFEQQQFP